MPARIIKRELADGTIRIIAKVGARELQLTRVPVKRTDALKRFRADIRAAKVERYVRPVEAAPPPEPTSGRGG